MCTFLNFNDSFSSSTRILDICSKYTFLQVWAIFLKDEMSGDVELTWRRNQGKAK